LHYTYSRLNDDSVSKLVESHYDSILPEICRFYISGLHDNYLVIGKKKKFILRVYRNDWRTDEEIFFELEFLKFLQSKSINISYPETVNDGKSYFYIKGPEGKRVCALFKYANGSAPENSISAEECELLGKHTANLHLASTNFQTLHKRPILDLSYLLDRSISLIFPFVSATDRTYLNQLQTQIQNNIPRLSKGTPEYCVCVGDINPTNFHINSAQSITMFDFDQCGYGQRSFDIGKFSSSMSNLQSKIDNIRSFLSGYQTISKLADIELELIPYFEVISKLWVMSIHVDNANHIGHKHLERKLWDRRMDAIRKLSNNVL